MKVIFSPPSMHRLRLISASLAAVSRPAAAAFQAELRTCIKHIARYPHAYRSVERNGLLLRLFSVRNYRFWYFIDKARDQAVIVDILHAHQQLPEAQVIA